MEAPENYLFAPYQKAVQGKHYRLDRFVRAVQPKLSSDLRPFRTFSGKTNVVLQGTGINFLEPKIDGVAKTFFSLGYANFEAVDVEPKYL
jgi:hypothetical protein